MWQQSRENKSDPKQQSQCFVQRSRQLIMVHCYLYYRFAITKKKPKVDVQWVLNKHPEATGEPSKKQELCFLADVLFRKPRATMALGYWKIHY